MTTLWKKGLPNECSVLSCVLQKKIQTNFSLPKRGADQTHPHPTHNFKKGYRSALERYPFLKVLGKGGRVWGGGGTFFLKEGSPSSPRSFLAPYTTSIFSVFLASGCFWFRSAACTVTVTVLPAHFSLMRNRL